MKIKNNTLANLSVGSVLTRGKAAKRWMVVPGESTLELEDDLWRAEFAEPAAKLIEAGNLVIVEAPALTEEEQAEQEAAELAAAEELLKQAASKKKAAPKAK